MMFQRTEEEICLIGRNGLVDNTDPRLHESLKQRMNLGKVQGEILMVRKDGTKFPVETLLLPYLQMASVSLEQV